MSVIVVSVIVSIAAVVGCLSYYAAGPDNAMEEVCEAVIEKETGADIDLSPSTPEKVELEQSPTVSPLSGVNGSSESIV